MFRLFAAIAIAAAGAGEASAQLDELRLGVAAHDWIKDREDGPQISVEALFDSPDLLAPALSPRPYLYASFNTQGFTNLVATGLAWNVDATDRLRFEASLGLAHHDGELDVVHLAPDDPVRIRRAESRILLGSRWLFRTQFGVDYALTERWAVGAYYEHFSHGQILDSGRNQGLDEAGVRLSYRFGR